MRSGGLAFTVEGLVLPAASRTELRKSARDECCLSLPDLPKPVLGGLFCSSRAGSSIPAALVGTGVPLLPDRFKRDTKAEVLLFLLSKVGKGGRGDSGGGGKG